MTKYIPLIAFILFTTWANAQECVVPAPVAPPKAIVIQYRFSNPDGGGRPCEGSAVATGAVGAPQWHPIPGAVCDVEKRRADQAVAIDNGWNDGGAL